MNCVWHKNHIWLLEKSKENGYIDLDIVLWKIQTGFSSVTSASPFLIKAQKYFKQEGNKVERKLLFYIIIQMQTKVTH